MNYFPRQTVVWKMQDTPGFRRITLSLVEMAALTGVVLHLYRAVAITNAPGDGWLYLIGTIALGVLFLFGMATLHLGNFPIRHWLWRVPAFAGIEALVESATSALLIALHREPLGTARAEFADWPALALRILLTRFVLLSLFALILAGVVQLVRRWLLHQDARTSTAEAIHDAEERRSAEHDRP